MSQTALLNLDARSLQPERWMQLVRATGITKPTVREVFEYYGKTSKSASSGARIRSPTRQAQRSPGRRSPGRRSPGRKSPATKSAVASVASQKPRITVVKTNASADKVYSVFENGDHMLYKIYAPDVPRNIRRGSLRSMLIALEPEDGLLSRTDPDWFLFSADTVYEGQALLERNEFAQVLAPTPKKLMYEGYENAWLTLGNG